MPRLGSGMGASRTRGLFRGLLDLSAGANAGGAFSSFALSHTTTPTALYAPVRRVSDNVEADVFPFAKQITLDSSVTITSGVSNATTLGELVAAPGYANVDSLGAADDAALTTWTDQKSPGVGDFVQTTAADQPLVVDGGVLLVGPTFDGTNDHMRIPDAVMPTLTDKFTISAVVKNDLADITANNSIIGQFDIGVNGRSIILLFADNEKVRILFGDPVDGTQEGTVESSSAVTTNELQAIGVTYNAGTVTLYRNGAILASVLMAGAVPTTLFNSSVDWTLGSFLDTNAALGNWDGLIAEIYFSATVDDIIAIQQNQMERFGIS